MRTGKSSYTAGHFDLMVENVINWCSGGRFATAPAGTARYGGGDALTALQRGGYRRTQGSVSCSVDSPLRLFATEVTVSSFNDMMMKVGAIKGSSELEGFKYWIGLKSLQFGTSRRVTSGAGGSMRESSAPNISEIVIAKEFDSASAKLYQDAVAGTFDSQVQIKLLTTAKDKLETFLTIDLTDCGVSSYSISSSGDRPTESLSLSFLKIMVTPTPLDKSGQIKRGDIVSYDLLAMKAS